MTNTLAILVEIEGSVIGWILDHFPMIGMILVAIVITFWIAWRIRDWLHSLDNKFLQIDQRFGQIDHRFVQIDQRFERFESRQNEFDKRLWRVEKRLTRVEKKVTGLDKKMDIMIAMFKASNPSVAKT